MAQATTYSGVGQAMIPSRELVSQIMAKTDAQASHRSEISQRAPSGGASWGGGQGLGAGG